MKKMNFSSKSLNRDEMRTVSGGRSMGGSNCGSGSFTCNNGSSASSSAGACHTWEEISSYATSACGEGGVKSTWCFGCDA